MKNTLQSLRKQTAGWTRLGLLGFAALMAGPVSAQKAGARIAFKPESGNIQLPAPQQILLPSVGSYSPQAQQQFVAVYRNSSKTSAIIASTATGGNWSATTTWVGGVVPGASDNVTIVAGATVTLDVNASAGSLTIDATGSLVTSATTGYKLEVGGNLTNNGILDLSNSATIGSDLRFVGAGNATFTGTGTTDLHTMSLAKSVRADIVDMNLPTLSVKGSTTSGDGFLFTRTTGATPADDMTGTLKISGTATIANKVFGNAAAYIIPATGGFWLNNANFTVTGQTASPTVNGLLQITNGTFNVGTGAGNSLGFGANSILTMEGGTINTAGRIGNFTSATGVSGGMTLNMSGGVINVATVGNAAATPSYGFAGTLLVSGGTVNLVQRSTNTAPLDYYTAGVTGFPTSSFTGGTLNVGTAATATNFDFRIKGSMPNLTIDNTGTAKSALTTATSTVNGSILINSGSSIVMGAQTNVLGSTVINTGATLNLNGFLLLQIGPAITNNGTLTATTTGSRLYFQGNAAQTIGGTGTFTSPIAQITIQNSGSGVSINAPIVTRNIAMFQGNLLNTNNLTIGNGAAAGNVIQFGVAGATTPAGSFNVAPNFNIGTGYLQMVYTAETVSRTTGVEIPATRTIDYLTISNPNGLVIAGGNLTVLGEPTASIFFTNGLITTTATNKLILGPLVTTTPTGTATSYVKGPLGITVNSATATSRTFAVGDAAGWRPVVVGGITTTGDQTYTATVINGATGGSVSGPISSLNPTRYVRLENTANLPATATVQLSYGADDVIGAPATAVIAQAATANGVYASIGGALATVPTTGIVSTQNITPGSEFFVIANTEGGTLASSVASVCSGTNSGTLTLSGLATGATITGYEANTGTGFTAVSGTNTAATYAFSNLNVTTTYRAVIQTSDSRTVYSAPVTVTVTPAANAAFAYSGNTFCLSGANPSPTITGTTGGTFSSTTGLSLNATTGAINLAASTPGTYTVTYAVAGTCPASSTASVTVTSAPVATFNYSAASFCQSATNPAPTFPAGSSGGTFSAGTGLSINATTGVINLAASTPGTYTVTNAIAASGSCAAATATFSVTVNAGTTATFNYGTGGTSFCKTAAAVTPTVTGTAGGSFTSTTGLTINATTGVITPSSSTAGTYTVTYSVAGTCPSTGTQTVTITAPATATFSYPAGALCTAATAAVAPTLATGSTAGAFTSTTGLTLNATTGAVTPSTSTPGTYTVTNTIAASGGCAAVTSTAQVTISANPTPTITGLNASYCKSAAAVTLASNLTGSTFTIDGTAAASFNPATLTAGSHVVVVSNTNTAGCSGTSTQTVTVTATPVTPTIAAGGATTFCQGGSVTLTGASTTTGATYQWFNNGTAITGATAATYSANAAGSYTVVATAGGCPSAASTATTVTVNPTPTTPTITRLNMVLTSSATTGATYQWYLNGVAIPGATSQTYTVAANGNYTVVVTTNGCPSLASAATNITNTGIADDLAAMKVSVYPNPTSGAFNVKLSGYQVNATVTLYNLAGQVIAAENVKAGEEIKTMNVKGLAAGTYLLKVTSDKGVQVSRLLVQ